MAGLGRMALRLTTNAGPPASPTMKETAAKITWNYIRQYGENILKHINYGKEKIRKPCKNSILGMTKKIWDFMDGYAKSQLYTKFCTSQIVLLFKRLIK